MRVLIDTCVIIDLLHERKPFVIEAKKIMQAAATERFMGYITAKSATDIYYFTHRNTHSDKESRFKLSQLLEIVGMLDSLSSDVFRAISSNVKDFEDAVMSETAVRSHIDCIVTRNEKDFVNAGVKVYTPNEFIKILEDE